MSLDLLQVGSLVVNPSRPEWGPGKVVKIAPERVHVVWRDLAANEAKVMVSAALRLAPDQRDEILENLPPLVEKDGKLQLPKNRTTFDQAVSEFRAHYPQGFYDPRFLGTSKFDGERA